MNEHNISRRDLLKSAAKAGAYVTVGLSTSFATAAISSYSEIREKPLNKFEQFVFDSLIRSMESSDYILEADISQFSKDLVAHLGPNFDYKKKYSGVMGEYDLARKFIKSTNKYSNTKSDLEPMIQYIGLDTGNISA